MSVTSVGVIIVGVSHKRRKGRTALLSLFVPSHTSGHTTSHTRSHATDDTQLKSPKQSVSQSHTCSCSSSLFVPHS